MLVFLDFEASSLSKQGYPIEIAWVFEDGRAEAHLIRPAPDWTDWDEKAQAIHGIDRETLLREGAPHEMVADRMISALAGHDLLASAPSWDGKWLSVLLRAAGRPRHALRLRDSDDALAERARSILPHTLSGEALEKAVSRILAATKPAGRPAHRALPDAEQERLRWLDVGTAAEAERNAAASTAG